MLFLCPAEATSLTVGFFAGATQGEVQTDRGTDTGSSVRSPGHLSCCKQSGEVAEPG